MIGSLPRSTYSAPRSITLFCLRFVLLLMPAGSVAEALDVPRLRARVTDHAQLLSPLEAEQLTNKLSDHEAKTGQQFALLTIESLQGEQLEQFALAIANKSRLGRAGYNDGLLVLVAMAEQKVRIEVGLGLGEAIPNEAAAAVIKEVLRPAFRSQRYGAGLDAAFARLMALGARAQIFRSPPPERGALWLGAVALAALGVAAVFWWRRRNRPGKSAA